jgi:hypothetical protein
MWANTHFYSPGYMLCVIILFVLMLDSDKNEVLCDLNIAVFYAVIVPLISLKLYLRK